MSNYLKPQSPLQKGTDYIYPLTIADQIIIDENGTRLGDGRGNLNISNSGESYSVALEALEKANAAQSTADDALKKANSAYNSIGAVNSIANSAQSSAMTAYSMAESANANAKGAQTTANIAKSTAVTAKSTADKAMPKANFSWDSSTATLNITL